MSLMKEVFAWMLLDYTMILLLPVILGLKSYSWPKVANYVKDYVSHYDRCQHFKVRNIMPAGKLQPLEVPHMPWVDITADFTIDLPLSNGFNSILVVID